MYVLFKLSDEAYVSKNSLLQVLTSNTECSSCVDIVRLLFPLKGSLILTYSTKTLCIEESQPESLYMVNVHNDILRTGCLVFKTEATTLALQNLQNSFRVTTQVPHHEILHDKVPALLLCIVPCG